MSHVLQNVDLRLHTTPCPEKCQTSVGGVCRLAPRSAMVLPPIHHEGIAGISAGVMQLVDLLLGPSPHQLLKHSAQNSCDLLLNAGRQPTIHHMFGSSSATIPIYVILGAALDDLDSNVPQERYRHLHSRATTVAILP